MPLCSGFSPCTWCNSALEADYLFNAFCRWENRKMRNFFLVFQLITQFKLELQ